MTTLRSLGRTAAVAVTAATLALGVAGCSSTVAKDDVAASIKTKLDEQKVGAGAVTCPADLTAEVGQSVRCEFQVDGQPVDAVATVRSVDGSTANYDITTEARPVAKSVLEKKVGDQVGQKAGVTVDSTVCTGDLPPTVGQSVTCSLTAGAEKVDVKVAVTGVDGGLINYSIDTA